MKRNQYILAYVIHLLECEYTYSESSSFKQPFVIAISSHVEQNVGLK